MIIKPVAPTLQHNLELADIFSKMSDCYQFIGPEHRFRANAYENVSKTLALMQEPIDEYADSIAHLDSLKGIGESIAEKIIEYLHTGKIKTYETLKKKVPFELLKLMRIEGIGAATLRQLNQKLGIQSKDEFIHAIRNHQLDHLKGYGPKKINNLKRLLAIEEIPQRLPFQEANKMAEGIKQAIEKIKGIENVYIAGSVRRKKETIGDIDILCTTTITPRKKITEAIKTLSFIKRIIEAGPTRISFVIDDRPLQVDLRIVTPDQLGAALLYFTGSKEHNIQLRTMAKQKGWKINEYGVFDERTGKRIAGKTEEEIYQRMGYRFIPPEKRLGKNEFQLAVSPKRSEESFIR